MRERLSSAIAGITVGVGTFVLLRWLRRRGTRTDRDAEGKLSAMVDEASLESFPASDPPSWTLGEERGPD